MSGSATSSTPAPLWCTTHIGLECRKRRATTLGVKAPIPIIFVSDNGEFVSRQSGQDIVRIVKKVEAYLAEYDDLNIKKLFHELFPMMRSITGSGFRNSVQIGLKNFGILAKEMKIPSGSKVFDWIVPAEWEIREAWVKNSKGKVIIDLNNSNLHILNFSSSFHGVISKDELLKHLHTMPDRPEWIPYRTSYYIDNWGFCCKHSLLSSEDFSGPFEVYIDSTKNSDSGNLYWYESEHKGARTDTILISTYFCHPSLANDNLSGFITALALFNCIRSQDTRLTYKLVIVPETIGSLAYLKSIRKKDLQKILGGFVVTTTAGQGPIGIKKTFLGDHPLDKISKQVCQRIDPKSFTYDFIPLGSDERQYSSPEFRIPTISITNSKYHEYDEYHSSADNLEYISMPNFRNNLAAHIEVVNWLEMNVTPRKRDSGGAGGEFQLGKYGLFPNIGGKIYQKAAQYENREINELKIEIFAWVMHLIDGKTSVLEMSEKSGIPFEALSESLELFRLKGLVSYL